MNRWTTIGVLIAMAVFPTSAFADQDAPALTAHFEELRRTDDESRIVELERAILGLWRRSGDTTVDASLSRAMTLVEQWSFDDALVVLDSVVARRPGFAEGWNQRASLHYLMNDFEASLRDIEETLALEPRHFGALAGLAEIRLKLGDPASALEAFEQALAFHPHLPIVKLKVARLRAQKARGRF